jgi:hypothetical protein
MGGVAGHGEHALIGDAAALSANYTELDDYSVDAEADQFGSQTVAEAYQCVLDLFHVDCKQDVASASS